MLLKSLGVLDGKLREAIVQSLKVKLESLESERSIMEERKHCKTTADKSFKLEREMHRAAGNIIKGKVLLKIKNNFFFLILEM